MNALNKDAPRLKFSGVSTILITLITMIFTEKAPLTTTQEWMETLFYIALYFISALSASNILKIVAEVSAQVLYISTEDDLDPMSKILLIKSQLELYSEQFNKVFTEVREFNSTKEKWHDTWENGKTAVKSIYKGSVSIYQTIWIVIYMSYRILIVTNYFHIDLPFNLIFTLCFIVMLEFGSANIADAGELIKDMFQAINVKDDKHVIKLSQIRHTIRLLCLSFNRIARHVEKITGKTIQELFITSDVAKIITSKKETVKDG